MPQVIEAIYYAVERGFKLPIVYNTSSYDSVKSIELLDGLVGELGGQNYLFLFIYLHYTYILFQMFIYRISNFGMQQQVNACAKHEIILRWREG